MIDSDLPEPQRHLLTSEEKNLRKYALIKTVFAFITSYAVLHKVLIPLSLLITPLAQGPYAQVDPWVLHPILLTFILFRSRSNSALISLLCGIGIVYGISEWISVARGIYGGWLAFSRLLSSTPFAIACAYFMCQRRFQPHFKAAWLGAASLCLTLFLFSLSPSKSLLPRTAAKLPGRDLPIEPPRCGSTRILVTPEAPASLQNQIEISDCGLFPPILIWRKGSLQISNHRKELVNLHLLIYKDGSLKSKWNLPVSAEGVASSAEILVEADSVAMLYSDSNPAVGIVALRAELLAKRFLLSRYPLKIEFIQ